MNVIGLRGAKNQPSKVIIKKIALQTERKTDGQTDRKVARWINKVIQIFRYMNVIGLRGAKNPP